MEILVPLWFSFVFQWRYWFSFGFSGFFIWKYAKGAAHACKIYPKHYFLTASQANPRLQGCGPPLQDTSHTPFSECLPRTPKQIPDAKGTPHTCKTPPNNYFLNAPQTKYPTPGVRPTPARHLLITIFLMSPKKYPRFQGCGPPLQTSPEHNFLNASQAISSTPGVWPILDRHLPNTIS